MPARADRRIARGFALLNRFAPVAVPARLKAMAEAVALVRAAQARRGRQIAGES
jgi:hypothetical protein